MVSDTKTNENVPYARDSTFISKNGKQCKRLICRRAVSGYVSIHFSFLHCVHYLEHRQAFCLFSYRSPLYFLDYYNCNSGVCCLHIQHSACSGKVVWSVRAEARMQTSAESSLKFSE